VPPTVVEFRAVSKSYPIYTSPSDRLKELLLLNRKSFHRDFWALRDVTFNIHRGETFCIVGENGSGKSTLLQIVAGILRATSGDTIVQGRVAALLELGSGFNPEFTGRDNVYLNGAILGLSRKEMDRKFPEIEEFAEIGDFIDQPVKTYSSGMGVRLAFAVAIHVDPEILLVDEALSVGDIYFRQRCMRKVHELRERGVTIVFVSHAIGDVKSIGDRAMWLDAGRIREMGDIDKVTTRYMAAMVEKDSRYLTAHHTPESPSLGTGHITAPEVIEHIPNIDHRHGDARAHVIGIAVLDHRAKPLPVLEPSSTIIVRISVRAHVDLGLPIVGFMLRNHMGLDFSGTNTAREDFELPAMHAGDVFTVDFHLQLPELYPSSFSFSPAIADGTLHNYVMCDWIDNAITIQMTSSPGQIYGYVHLPCHIELNRKLGAPLADAALAHAESPLG
jgi:lipopolysaccharide transport system ATP-binding protein